MVEVSAERGFQSQGSDCSPLRGSYGKNSQSQATAHSVCVCVCVPVDVDEWPRELNSGSWRLD